MAKKILHLWNTAGIGSILAKYTDRLYGTQSKVMMKKSFDRFGFTTVGELIDTDKTLFAKFDFYRRCLRETNRVDLVHIHAFYRIVPLVRFAHPLKSTVYHCHGTDVRHKWKQRTKYLNFADIILYHARDLEGKGMPRGMIYVHCPVDTEYFNDNGKEMHQANTALTFSYRADHLSREYAKKHGLDLTIHNRESKPIRYPDLASVLRRYEYYLDFKLDTDNSRYFSDSAHYTLSKTALEALACGCKVVGHDLVVRKGLPKEHEPERVAQAIWEIYQRNGLI